MLGDSRDGQGLSRKRLPQERLKRWRQRIVWPLQRGIHLNDACPEFLRETSKIFVIVIHGGTPEDGSVRTKKRPGYRPLVAKEWNSAEELWLFVCGERPMSTELVALNDC